MVVEFEWTSLLLNVLIRLRRVFIWVIRRTRGRIANIAAGITTMMIMAMDIEDTDAPLHLIVVEVIVPVGTTIDLDLALIHLVDIRLSLIEFFNIILVCSHRHLFSLLCILCIYLDKES